MYDALYKHKINVFIQDNRYVTVYKECLRGEGKCIGEGRELLWNKRPFIA